MHTTIRQASTDDLHEVARLFDAYRQFYGQASDLAGARAFLAERMQRGESLLLVAQQGDALVGFTQLYPLFSSVRMARAWLLNDLYVHDGARRGGVGRKLLAAAAASARDTGALRIVLETGVDNAPARALYRSAGWNEESTQWYALDLGVPTPH